MRCEADQTPLMAHKHSEQLENTETTWAVPKGPVVFWDPDISFHCCSSKSPSLFIMVGAILDSDRGKLVVNQSERTIYTQSHLPKKQAAVHPEALFEVCCACLCTVTPRAEFNPSFHLLQHPGLCLAQHTGLGRFAPLAGYRTMLATLGYYRQRRLLCGDFIFSQTFRLFFPSFFSDIVTWRSTEVLLRQAERGNARRRALRWLWIELNSYEVTVFLAKVTQRMWTFSKPLSH